MQTTFVQQASDNPSAQTNSRQDSLLVPPPAAPGHVTAGARKRRLKTGRRIRWPAETTGANGNGQANRALIEALSSSRIYKEYERAFVELTGQPMSLQPVETWQLPYHGRRNENPFCALISGRSRACAACLQVRERLCQQAASRPRTVLCHSGLCETAVPVRLSDRVVGFLQTGQVFQKKPGPRQFDQVAAQVAGWGLGVNREALKRAYFSGKVVSPSGHESAVKLLAIFAQHLALISNQVI
ncbi:MAG: PocR ligand-binding domain-containing protein, partial [Verrucomicrobia bacterium]|nr:PocR ligand-binding domain-containing protein [Verrucomicrobiota bacterium]